MKRSLVVFMVSVFILAGSGVAYGCPTCYGAADSPMTDGMNMAILTLLGITGFVLAGFVSFFLYLRRRAMMINRMFSNRLN